MRALFYSQSWSTIVFWVAFAIWAIPEFVGAFTQYARGSASRRDRGSYIVVILGILVGIYLAFFLASAVPGATLGGGWQVIFGVGIALALLGVALRWYAIWVLGRYFTRDVAVQPGQQVVQSGPYRFIRHPSYSGTLLAMLGLGLAFTNWASLVALVACTFATHMYRVLVEEQALREALGQPYVDYMRHTRRFIPFLF
jgi:protein-S-isoprenylcysteine O-methyltransferase Ste14